MRECWWNRWRPRLFQLKAGLPAGADGLGPQGQRQQGCAVRQGLRAQGGGRWKSGRSGGHRRAEAESEGQQDGADGPARAAGVGRCSVRREDPALPVRAGIAAAWLPGHRLGSSRGPPASPSHSLRRAASGLTRETSCGASAQLSRAWRDDGLDVVERPLAGAGEGRDWDSHDGAEGFGENCGISCLGE